MVSFNSLSEGEKFAFSRDFLVKFRVIQKLRPELTEEKDILTLVAKKFYGEDPTNLEECIKFMDEKVKIDSLSSVNLDEPIRKYEESLKKSIKERAEKLEQERKDEEEKLMEYKRETSSRNYFDKEYNGELSRQRRNKTIKNILLTALIVSAILILPAFGGLVGATNALLSFVANMSSLQVLTLGGLVYFGWKKGWTKNAKGKFDGWRKGRKDKRDKRLAGYKERQELHQKEQERVAGERAKIHTERLADMKAQEKAMHDLEAEKVHISRYERINNFDKLLKTSEVEIKDKYEKALRMYGYDDEKKNLSQWYEHYIGSLYYGAYIGALKNRADVESLIERAGAKFEQLANPLNINRNFSEDNVRAQTDSVVNKPLEEMYQLI